MFVSITQQELPFIFCWCLSFCFCLFYFCIDSSINCPWINIFNKNFNFDFYYSNSFSYNVTKFQNFWFLQVIWKNGKLILVSKFVLLKSTFDFAIVLDLQNCILIRTAWNLVELYNFDLWHLQNNKWNQCFVTLE